MFDTYGDGWNGNYFEIEGNGSYYSSSLDDWDDATINYDGFFGQFDVCLYEGCYHVTVGGGSWQEEVYWQFAGQTGGAPFDGEICVEAVFYPEADELWDYIYNGDMFNDGMFFYAQYGYWYGDDDWYMYDDVWDAVDDLAY